MVVFVFSENPFIGMVRELASDVDSGGRSTRRTSVVVPSGDAAWLARQAQAAGKAVGVTVRKLPVEELGNGQARITFWTVPKIAAKGSGKAGATSCSATTTAPEPISL